MTTFKTVAAAIALAATIAAPAYAGPSASGKGVADVSYADLNLGSEKGREVLDRRIKRAVQKVCGRKTGKALLDVTIRECTRDTMASAKVSRDLAVANYASQRLAKADAKTIRLQAN